MTLLAHAGADYVSMEQLVALPPPAPMGPMHQPVPHSALVHAMQLAALERGFQVTHQSFALARQGTRMFGVLDLIPPEGVPLPETHGFSIGFRNSTDESLAIRLVAGARVFVCDNLAMSGDLIALKRRNTTRLDLGAAMSDAFDRYVMHAAALNRQLFVLQDTGLTDDAAKAKVADLFVERVLPLRLFHTVARNYFNPSESMTDCRPRTVWGLHNACTRAVKVLPPRRRFEVSVGLGKAFGLRDRADA